jgi:predicted glycosyltransferase
MRVLIDIGHPAHVHLFTHFALETQSKGHTVLFTCRDKEFEIDLLKSHQFTYKNFGKKYKSTIAKLWGLLKFDWMEWKTALSFKPDVFISHGSMYAAHAAFLRGKPHISLEDTFNFEQIRLYLPFTDVVLTSDYEHPFHSNKVIHYAGYHELAYLYPYRFTPDITVLQELGVSPQEKYVIVRFVSWNASHDIGHKGISFENKLKAIKAFSNYAKVFISSESELPEELKPYQMPIRPERIHHALAFASFLWGESFTMPAECSVLGVPSIINHNTTSYYLKEQQEKYNLCYNYTESLQDQEKAITKGIELLQRDKTDLQKEWQQKRERMLEDKIDVTAFLVWFVENYPESKEIMKENPEYQYNFK